MFIDNKKPSRKPHGLRDDELVKSQIERISKLGRYMNRRETELKFQHLKEMQSMQSQTKAAALVNTSYKFFKSILRWATDFVLDLGATSGNKFYKTAGID